MTDGTTLLGADDKAGVAEIFTAMEYLIEHPEIKHGKSVSALPQMKRLGWVQNTLISKNSAQHMPIPLMPALLASWNMRTSML